VGALFQAFRVGSKFLLKFSTILTFGIVYENYWQNLKVVY